VQIRDRVRELVRVPASEILPNPRNWRTHPERQRDALKGILAEIGFAGALLARRRDDGALELIDGHLRAETAPDAVVPVLVTDLDESEAALLLATLDPLGALAEADGAKLDALLRDVSTGSAALTDLLAELAEGAGLYPPGDGDGGGGAGGETLLDQAVQLKPGREYAMVVCDSPAEWEAVKVALGLKPVRRGGYRLGSPFDDVGTQRVVPASDLLDLLASRIPGPC
jgi:hypothetical protein